MSNDNSGYKQNGFLSSGACMGKAMDEYEYE